MRRFSFLAVVACVWGFALSGTGRADTITQNFTVTVGPPPVTLTEPPNDLNDFFQSLQQFNPANGTLTSVSMSIAGTATWTSTSVIPRINIGPRLQNVNFAFGFQAFSTPGTITINQSGSSSDAFLLGQVTGTGTIPGGFSVDVQSFQPSTDTFETVDANGHPTSIAGTITYTFTTPEPASLTLFGISAVGVLGYAWRKRAAA